MRVKKYQYWPNINHTAKIACKKPTKFFIGQYKKWYIIDPKSTIYHWSKWINDRKVCENYPGKEKRTIDSNNFFKLQKPRPSCYITNNQWFSLVLNKRPSAQNVLDQQFFFWRSFVPNRISWKVIKFQVHSFVG